MQKRCGNDSGRNAGFLRSAAPAGTASNSVGTAITQGRFFEEHWCGLFSPTLLLFNCNNLPPYTQVLFLTFTVVLVSGSPHPHIFPRECPLTLFLEQKAHVCLRLCFFSPTINFDQLSNIKAPFIEVIPHPLVFRIIEVTGQSVQVVIHFFVVFCTKRKNQTASETPLRTHRTPQITSIFFLNPLPTVLKTKTDTKHHLLLK